MKKICEMAAFVSFKKKNKTRIQVEELINGGNHPNFVVTLTREKSELLCQRKRKVKNLCEGVSGTSSDEDTGEENGKNDYSLDLIRKCLLTEERIVKSGNTNWRTSSRTPQMFYICFSLFPLVSLEEKREKK
eukprot:GDKK01013822.1.p1 GENE.GDKK01013822.1~~GDKK01013822.1.p1  ORF type:complete len:132 (+),score=14.00 GDKK01013822.1:759-1154(+)